MPSVRYYNQTAPFWDFVANLEEQGSSHPAFGSRGGVENENAERPNPWAQGWAGFPFGPVPHRGHHRHPHHHHGPPPPPGGDQDGQEAPPEYQNEKEGEAGPSEDKPEAGPSRFGPDARRGGRCGGPGGRGRGAWGARGRGHWGGRGGFPMGGFGHWANIFQEQMFGEDANKEKSEEFQPDVDVFDAAEAFVIHVSLPGAKKEDIGVNWDAEKSELSIAGVVYRPGDEEFLKTLAMDERKVGAFDRKVRLGSRANPAQVDVDAITARMDDGILTVEVPKLDSGYVEIKKVDIE
jgi:HSP20 family protein